MANWQRAVSDPLSPASFQDDEEENLFAQPYVKPSATTVHHVSPPHTQQSYTPPTRGNISDNVGSTHVDEVNVMQAGQDILRSSDNFLADVDIYLPGGSGRGAGGVFGNSGDLDQYTGEADYDFSSAIAGQLPLSPPASSIMASDPGPLVQGRGGYNGPLPGSGGNGMYMSQQVDTRRSGQQSEYRRTEGGGSGGFLSQSAYISGTQPRRGSAGAANASGYRPLSQVHEFSVHSYMKPTLCDSCGKLLVGFTSQGHQCGVCGMNVHGGCTITLCSPSHTCRPPPRVLRSDGVAPEVVAAVLPSPGANGEIPLAAANTPDPLSSDWHLHMVRAGQMCVPDNTAVACMVCSKMFHPVMRRRHHCRRCGACICGTCSGFGLTDRMLVKDTASGAVGLIRAVEFGPVRTCTLCTRVVDELLAKALGKKIHIAQAEAAAARPRGMMGGGASMYRQQLAAHRVPGVSGQAPPSSMAASAYFTPSSSMTSSMMNSSTSVSGKSTNGLPLRSGQLAAAAKMQPKAPPPPVPDYLS